MKIENTQVKEQHSNSPASLTQTKQQLEIETAEEQSLVKIMIEKEARLKQLVETNRTLKKENNHFKRSKTWKLAAPLRKLTAMLNMFRSGVNKDQEAENQRLQKELNTLQEELKISQEQLQHYQLESNHIDGKQLQQSADSAKKNGETMNYIYQLIQGKEKAEHNYSRALIHTARLFHRDKVDFKQTVYSEALSGLHAADVPEFIVRFAEQDNTLSLEATASFSAALTNRARMRQLSTKDTPEQLLDHKLAAYRLMDNLEIRRPWTMEKHYQMAEIPNQEAMAIKPVNGAGSRGVYLVFHSEKIQDVKRSRMLESWEELQASMQEDITSGWVQHDEWMLEELILSNSEEDLPATDLKFYCFYGRVALILEITRFPEVRYCWWTPDGERISTGKYDEFLFKGEGVTMEDIEEVKAISAEVPVPFLRIDFLRTDHGLVFGEFTPKPGNYETFNKKTDQWLGNYYLEAEARLTQDLLDGKSFTAYHNWAAQLQKVKELSI